MEPILYTHDMLITVIQTKFPALMHGRDFLVGHPVDPATNRQTGEPFIAVWKSAEIPQPDAGTLKAEFAANESTYRAMLIRTYRDRLLVATDGKANPPQDAPPDVKAQAAAWQQYRQTLRDLTGQPDFPFNVQWPAMPA